jgi:TetR/AcrR family transcriptional regulator, transcriptional repressor for nem operon
LPDDGIRERVAWHGKDLDAQFCDGYLAKVDAFEAPMSVGAIAADRRHLALTIVAAEIGAMGAARAVAKSDPALSDEILQAVHSVLVQVAKGP